MTFCYDFNFLLFIVLTENIQFTADSYCYSLVVYTLHCYIHYTADIQGAPHHNGSIVDGSKLRFSGLIRKFEKNGSF